MKIAELQAKRATVLEKAHAIADLDVLTVEQEGQYKSLMTEAKGFADQIERKRETEKAMAEAAVAVGTTGGDGARKVKAAVKEDAYVKDPSLVVGAMIKMVAKAKGDSYRAFDYAESVYGASHPVTEAMGEAKALNTASGSAGGFVVPPDFVATIIPLLYAKTVVRKAGARPMPMPHGTMTLPKQTGGSSAYWIGETRAIGESAPAFGQIAATAHKLAALVPVSNDQMRYATPEFDSKVRNDLVQQIALAEDSAFLNSTGTQFKPKGLASFCLPSQTITSNPVYTLDTVANELTGAVTKLELANLPLANVAWIMSPRTKNFLLNLRNAQGFYIYKEEMTKQKTLLDYPFFTTTQEPINLTVGANSDCSTIKLVDFGETMILESRAMEFAISTEGVYVDANGQMQSAFQNDLMLIRAILAEDFQMDHDEGVVMINGVRWSPTLS